MTETQKANSDNIDIANQWIEYLKSKNKTLSFMWILFLCTSLTFAGVSASLFLRLNETRKEVSDSRLALDQLSSEKESTKQKNEKLSVQLKSVQDQADSLQATIDDLNAYKGESDTQIDLSSKLVDALKQKIRNLESDNSVLEEALMASQQKAGDVGKRVKDAQQLVGEQRKQLSSRKAAYDALAKRQLETQEEMQRLADELSRSSERETEFDKRNARLSTQIKAKNQELALLKDENNELKQKLKTLTTPIAIPASPVKKPATQIEEPANAAQAAVKSKTEQKSKTLKPKSDLDFERISID